MQNKNLHNRVLVGLIVILAMALATLAIYGTTAMITYGDSPDWPGAFTVGSVCGIWSVTMFAYAKMRWANKS